MPHSIAKHDCQPLLAFHTERLTRRRWLAASLAGLIAQSSLSQRTARGKASDNSTSIENCTRVKSVLEVKGQVKLKNYRSKTAGDQRSAPVEAKSTLEYEEAYRVAANPQRGSSDIAYQVYSEADLENQIEKHATKLSLRETCRELVRMPIPGKMTTLCLDHPLTAAERDLVEGPLSTMYLEHLMPSRAIQLGDSWVIESDIVMKLLNLDSVSSGELKVTLIEADEATGQLALKGSIRGEVRNVETAISVEGKAKIDREAGIVNWVAMSLEEDREVSESEPGFAIQARLRILREKISGLSSGQTLGAMAARSKDNSAIDLVQFDSKLGAYRFVADRYWTTYNDSGVDATLRWVQKNRVVAQCTITNLTDMEPGRQLSIEGYQNDIQKSLGKRFGQFLEADERISQTGLRMMRIVTIGQVEGVPVQWIHLLLSNDSGRHLSLAYSMNATSVETFGTNDLQMAGSLEFTLKQLPTAPEEPKEGDVKSNEPTKSATKPTAKAR